MEQKNGFKAFLTSSVGKAVLIVVLYVLIWGLMLLCTELFASSEYVPVIFAVVFGFFGWKALNKITPSIFLFLPLIGWVIYFVVKGLISVVIGMFVAPFVISKKIVGLIN